MLNALIANYELISAVAVIVGLLAQWFRQRMNQQRERFDARLKEFEVRIESARNENLQQRAIADSIYSQAATLASAMKAIQILAQRDIQLEEFRDDLQRVLNICEKESKRADRLYKIAVLANERRQGHDEDYASSVTRPTRDFAIDDTNR